ncbi:MAG TPA: class I SAM-dependent methyltransferase [Acidimicrobiales bacterium]|nr:class I SAM-dependent methyltransferase [Acidimicrobiales bacterium]
MSAAPPTATAYPYQEEVNQAILGYIDGQRVPADRRRVLDVGCGYGALGQEFRDRGYEVWGIERDPTAVSRATERLDRVVTADLTDTDLIARELAGNRFETIVFSDVLEHMPDPHGLVVGLLPHLAPGGRVIISVPNVANWHTRLSLLFGRFTYRDTGVLDRTHVRFFTVRSATEFVRGCGLQVRSMHYTPMLVRVLLPLVKARLLRPDASAGAQAISGSPLYRRYLRWVYPIERRLARLLPGLLAFQVVIVAEASPEGPST